jgi:hypothetical protein
MPSNIPFVLQGLSSITRTANKTKVKVGRSIPNTTIVQTHLNIHPLSPKILEIPCNRDFKKRPKASGHGALGRVDLPQSCWKHGTLDHGSMQHSPNDTSEHANRFEGTDDVDEDVGGCVVDDEEGEGDKEAGN